MEEIFAFIDANRDRYVKQLQRLVRQPTIASQKIGLEEGAALVCDIMSECGIPSQVFSIPDGAPIIFSQVDCAHSPRTLLNYAHYDVQPPEPLELWTRPPFGAEIDDGVVYGRGVVDDKSGLLAFVQALEAFLKVRGEPPVTTKLIFEGMEETGSVGFEAWVKENAGLLQADATFGLDGGVNKAVALPEIILGIKSVLYLELRIKGLDREIHSGLPNSAPNSAWRLVKALDTLVDDRGKIAIPGWYDELEPIAEEDRALMEQVANRFDREQLAEQLGLTRLPEEVPIVDLLLDAYYGATCNITGLRSGHIGEGIKTILPMDAVARIDFRLPPALDPARQLERLKTHLTALGFADVSVHCDVVMAPPWRFSPQERIARAAIKAAEIVFGQLPLVFGLSAQGMILRHLPTMAAAFSGFGPPDPRIHAADENMPIECYIRGIKYAAAVMEEYGA